MTSNDDINRVEAGPHVDEKPANTETIETIKPENYSSGKDRAGQLLKEAGHSVVVTPAENKRILRKIDLAILPILLAIYFLQSLDKTSLAYASVFGLIDHAHLVGDEYSWLGAVVYVAQLVWQPVIAYFLVKFPIGKFCATMVLCWGIVLCGMTAAKDFGGLMATRFLLGSFEASVAPTFIAIVQMWYRRSEQTNRNAAWYSMVSNMLRSQAILHSSAADTVQARRRQHSWLAADLRIGSHRLEGSLSLSGQSNPPIAKTWAC
jgi:hypothetical protein